MEEILEILKTHLEKYPEMTPQDCFKLIYQNELGPGHLVRDEKESPELLKKEWDSIEAEPWRHASGWRYGRPRQRRNTFRHG